MARKARVEFGGLVVAACILAGALFFLLPPKVFANIDISPNLTRADLVGVWQGIDSRPGCAVYEMIVSKEGDADLIHVIAVPGEGGISEFLGHATSIELSDGNLKIRFVLAPKHVRYSVWVEIEGHPPGHRV